MSGDNSYNLRERGTKFNQDNADRHSSVPADSHAQYPNEEETPPNQRTLQDGGQLSSPLYNWENSYNNDSHNERHPWKTKDFGRDLWSLWLRRQSGAPGAGLERMELRSPSHYKNVTILYKDLLSEGRRIGEISKRWAVNDNMLHLKELMYFLFQRGNTRLALRFLEAYVATPMRSIYNRGQYQAEVVDAVFSAFLKEVHLSRLRRHGDHKFARIWNRANKLANLAIVMIKQDLFYGIREQLKILMQTTAPSKVLELYRELRNKEVFLAEGAHLMFLFHFARNSFFTEAFATFQEICGLHGRLGDTYKSPARLWAFRELFVQLYRSGVPIHTSDLLKILFSYNNEVDHQIHNAFLFSAAKAGDVNDAEALFRDAEAVTGRPPTIHAYTALFNMYHQVNDLNRMERIHLAAVDAGLQPEKDVFFVNAVLHAESRLVRKSYAQILQRYKEFFSTEPLDRLHLPDDKYAPFVAPQASSLLVPSTATVSIMLRAFFMQREPYERYTHWAWIVYQQYLRNLADPSAGPQFETPSEHIFSIIVANLGLSRYDLPRAVSVVQNMLVSASLPNPTIITWNPLMRSYARHADVSGAEKVWNLIVGHGLRPDDHSYNALLLAYVRAGNNAEAGRVLARMLKEGWKWNSITHATVDMAADKMILLRAFRDEKEKLGLGADDDLAQSAAVKMNSAYDPVNDLVYEELPL